MEINTINKTASETEENVSKLVFNAAVAKGLVEDYGHRIIGLKANRNDPKMTIFVFADSLKFRDDMQKVIKKRRAARKARTEAETEKEPILQED